MKKLIELSKKIREYEERDLDSMDYVPTRLQGTRKTSQT